MTYLIDRRLQGKNKSAVNRERFLRRYKGQIKDAVGRAIKGRSITDIENGEKVSIPVKDVSEPSFGHAHGGVWEVVNPGNQEYQKGDQINRPKGGAGSGRGRAGSRRSRQGYDREPRKSFCSDRSRVKSLCACAGNAPVLNFADRENGPA